MTWYWRWLFRRGDVLGEKSIVVLFSVLEFPVDPNSSFCAFLHLLSVLLKISCSNLGFLLCRLVVAVQLIFFPFLMYLLFTVFNFPPPYYLYPCGLWVSQLPFLFSLCSGLFTLKCCKKIAPQTPIECNWDLPIAMINR